MCTCDLNEPSPVSYEVQIRGIRSTRPQGRAARPRRKCLHRAGGLEEACRRGPPALLRGGQEGPVKGTQ
eukprot:1485018-Prymnesium_polylepis.1